MIRSWMAAALLAAAGCSGASVGMDPAERYADLADRNAAMARRVNAEPVTGLLDMPVTGAARYDGHAVLTMGAADETKLIGDAALVAEFGLDRISGTVGNMVGSLDGGAIQALDGELRIRNGDLRAGSPSRFTADIAGVLTGRESGVVGVDGSIFGNFRGRSAGAPPALNAAQGAGTRFTLDGRTQPGLLGIVAERR